MRLDRLFFLIPMLMLASAGMWGSCVAWAQDRDPYTLERSIAEAMENNPDLRATMETKYQAEMAKKQAGTEFLPKASTTYGYTRFNEAPQFRSDLLPGVEINVGTVDNYQWKGTVTQPLFTGFALTSAYELAKLGVDQAELNIARAKLDLILSVKEAYFNVLIADKAVLVAEQAVQSLESNRNVADNFYKVGIIPVNDLLKAEVELANARQKLVGARNSAVLARAAFNNVLGRPVALPVQVQDILAYSPEEGDFVAYVSKALKNRPEMKLLDTNILQVEQQKRIAASDYYPDVVLSYDYIKEGDSPGVSGSPYHDANSWQITAGLTWTFWEWGKTRYAVHEKESLQRELMHTRQSLEEGIGLEVKNAMLEISTAAENIPTTEKALGQAEENLRVNEERYKAEVTTITEVLDAQTLLTEARVNYYRALYNHNLAKARLQRAMGIE
ncbi:TolC family protein [Desulfatiglans anilini]|uniref:TolC family protein n=1 Tax=Desulfatiglans anilini TaxID=90728 RepID=UPI0003FBE8EE|nr:TolC family protein [Desulfatiglans anilini]